MKTVIGRAGAIAGVALLAACAFAPDAEAVISRRKTENADIHSARCTIAEGKMTRSPSSGAPRYACTDTAADKACAAKHGAGWTLKNEGEPGARCEPPAAPPQ